jgi:hypothetical protein
MEQFLGGLLFGLLLGLLGTLWQAGGKWQLGKSVKELERSMVLTNQAHAETLRLRDEETGRIKKELDGVRSRLKSLETSSKGKPAAKLEVLETALRIASERHPELARVLPEAVSAAEAELVEVEQGKRRFLPFALSSLKMITGKKDAVDAEVLEEESTGEA